MNETERLAHELAVELSTRLLDLAGRARRRITVARLAEATTLEQFLELAVVEIGRSHLGSELSAWLLEEARPRALELGWDRVAAALRALA